MLVAQYMNLFCVNEEQGVLELTFLTTANQTFQSAKPAHIWRLLSPSSLVTLPLPEPVSSSSLVIKNSRSSAVRKLAVPGLSGRKSQIKDEMKTVAIPSRIKIL